MRNQDTRLVREYYESTAENYDKQYDTPYWKLYHEVTWGNIRTLLPKRKNATILDAGGGTGYWAIRLAKLGYRVVLTDISRNMLKVAKEKVKREGLQTKIETMMVDIRDMSCFRSNHFDMALAEGDPVSYCLNAEKAIGELARVIRSKSHMIVSVDNKYPIISRLIEENSFDKISDLLKTGILEREFGIQAFTPGELEKLFETCGLEVIRVIGKPILTQLVSREKRNEVVEKDFGRILKLELEFCDVPSLIGVGGHLEIVGVKHS